MDVRMDNVLIGRSALMKEVFALLPIVANSETTVLIEGASGTGKELIAREIHRLSTRRSHHFIAINCGALPDSLLESELFGYRRGAFTDARASKPGRFAAAEGGSLFLDEIGDISFAMQAKLLRVLQEHTYEPLGMNEPVKANVRILAATNRDLECLVKEGKFREDLYYRIVVVRICLPLLRDRREDIAPLIEHFIKCFNKVQNKRIVSVSDHARRLLLEYVYPGNVRELQNIIEHAFVLTSGDEIGVEQLPRWLKGRVVDQTGPHSATLKDMERIFICDALERNGGNRRAAARELGIHPSTLFRKASALGIQLPEKDGRQYSRHGA
jgi:transcriptional regulator with PAS, ATPase and Fis domain